MGVFEINQFTKGTEEIAIIADLEYCLFHLCFKNVITTIK